VYLTNTGNKPAAYNTNREND